VIGNRVTSPRYFTNGRFPFSKRSIGQWLYLMDQSHIVSEEPRAMNGQISK